MQLENVDINDEVEYTKWFKIYSCLSKERKRVNNMTNHIKYKHIRDKDLLT